MRELRAANLAQYNTEQSYTVKMKINGLYLNLMHDPVTKFLEHGSLIKENSARQ